MSDELMGARFNPACLKRVREEMSQANAEPEPIVWMSTGSYAAWKRSGKELIEWLKSGGRCV